MHSLRPTLVLLLVSLAVLPSSFAQTATAKIDLTQPQDYVLKRVSSFDPRAIKGKKKGAGP